MIQYNHTMTTISEDDDGTPGPRKMTREELLERLAKEVRDYNKVQEQRIKLLGQYYELLGKYHRLQSKCNALIQSGVIAGLYIAFS